MTEFLWESGFVLFVAVLFGTPLIGLAWFIRRRRWWSAVVLGGAVVITVVSAWLDLGLDPPPGGVAVRRFILWPVEVLLLAIGPGPQFESGLQEWTPAHMMATAGGYGASWAFWLIIARLGWRRLVGVRPYR